MPPGNIPENTHWVDLTRRDSMVVISQPPGQKNAVLGGIMASRMRVLGARGVVVAGRIRDSSELKSSGLPIWAAGTSTVGAGAASKVHSVNVPIEVNGVIISPDDIVFADPVEGVVVVPASRLDDVLSLLPRLTEADRRVKEDVDKGRKGVGEAFIAHRGA
ncbi:MAG: hypothetical protein M1824_006026 [Vezdaea acicularis]|nr:MAG: hypothetical protein M1824_006026 [Vezdaea acicularis]